MAHPIAVLTRCANSENRRSINGEVIVRLEQTLRKAPADAKAMLEGTDLNIEEIAFRVGYGDVSAFRNLFRALAGIPPGVFRRRFKLTFEKASTRQGSRKRRRSMRAA